MAALFRARAHRHSVIGSVAHVAIAIPQQGVGAIALVVGSRRTTLPARSDQGQALARGTEVVVLEQHRRVTVVTPLRLE